MSRIELAKIPSLIFYKDAYTTARRTSALPQLNCIGKACGLYQPEVIRCVSLGGTGTDIDWKCEADLPESLRFGKVEVSCEGWSKPGDPYVLKGSCALDYRLVQVPDSLRKTENPIYDLSKSYDYGTVLVWIIWFLIIAFILYGLFHSTTRESRTSNTSPPTPRNSGGGGGARGVFPGDYDPDYTSPPPYSKNHSNTGWESWRPGFWTGAALGGLANHVWNRNRETERVVRPSMWDWERERMPFSSGSIFGARRAPVQRPTSDDDDRGEGSSNLGTVRKSTGLGGTNVR